jgi:L-rhamnose isomerase / sugar isomerase
LDQSHNLKGKMEAMIQTVCTAHELYAKAAIVDHGAYGATAAELLAGRG